MIGAERTKKSLRDPRFALRVLRTLIDQNVLNMMDRKKLLTIGNWRQYLELILIHLNIFFTTKNKYIEEKLR